jgi:hypothetical protein
MTPDAEDAQVQPLTAEEESLLNKADSTNPTIAHSAAVNNEHQKQVPDGIEDEKLKYLQKKIQPYKEQSDKKLLEERKKIFKDRFGSIARWVGGIALGVAMIAGAPITIPVIGSAVGGLVGIAGVVGIGSFAAGVIGRAVGSGVAQSKARKNKTLQTIVNGITNVMTRIGAFFRNESPKAPENIFVDPPNPIGNIKLETVDDLSSKVPYKDAKKIIDDIGREPDELLLDLKKDNLISKDNGIKLSDLIYRLPANDKNLEKEYENLKSYFTKAETTVDHSENHEIPRSLISQAEEIGHSIHYTPSSTKKHPLVQEHEEISK